MDVRVFGAAVVGLVFGIIFFFKGIGWMKQKRLIENIPTSKIRSIAMGLVEVYGDVETAFTKNLKSPLSDKECVYYRFTVEELRQSGKHSRWVTIRKDEHGVRFNLRDSTGKVMVDPKGAEVDIPHDFKFQSGMGTDPPESVKRYLRRNGLSFEGFLGINKSMRFTEHYIAPKDKLYVIGTADDNPFVEDATAKKGVEDVIIRKGKHEKMFYISDKEESKILVSLTWKVIGGLFGGGLLTVGCLALILLFLGVF